MISASRIGGHRVPAEVTSFIGRSHEVSAVRRRLSTSRLVTLIGTGGVGKTRIAQRVGSEVRRAYPDGVVFVALDAVQSDQQLEEAVASALGLTNEGPPWTPEILCELLRESHLLLILDTCDRLLEECAQLVDGLLSNCPTLRILATSRESLGLFGEAVVAVAPFEPAAATPSGRENDAVALFTERASSAAAGFERTDANAAIIGEICDLVDGLPLAIELAAVRVAVLPLEQILALAHEPYRFLVGGSRSSAPRQRSLRGSADWSYALCTDDEKLLWSRLSVFTGGFELDAVTDICCADTLDGETVVDIVHSLVNKSILVRTDDQAAGRYTMLRTTRLYGWQRFTDLDDIVGLQIRHRNWYQRFVRRAELGWIGPRQIAWMTRLEHELGNIRSALQFCLNHDGDDEQGLAIAEPLWMNLWWTRGLAAEGKRWLDQALTATETSTASEPSAAFERLTATARPSATRARALLASAVLGAAQSDSTDATSQLTQVRAIASEMNDGGVEMAIARSAGWIALYQAHPLTGVSELVAALELLGPSAGAANRLELLLPLAFGYMSVHDDPMVISTNELILELSRSLQEGYFRSYALWGLGILAGKADDLPRAMASQLECLGLKRTLGDVPGIALTVEALAYIASCQGQYERSVVLLTGAKTVWTSSGLTPFDFGDLAVDRATISLRATQSLTTRRYADAVKLGLALNPDGLFTFALDEAPPTPSREAASTPSALTSRENEIAALISSGLTNKQIARRLVISQRTAEGHVQRILRKLEFTSRTQVSAWAYQNLRKPD